MASYLYGRAKSVNDGGSDQAASNFANNYVPGNPNQAPLTEYLTCVILTSNLAL